VTDPHFKPKVPGRKSDFAPLSFFDEAILYFLKKIGLEKNREIFGILQSHHRFTKQNNQS
jgi:hypothetical protein